MPIHQCFHLEASASPAMCDTRFGQEETVKKIRQKLTDLGRAPTDQLSRAVWDEGTKVNSGTQPIDRPEQGTGVRKGDPFNTRRDFASKDSHKQDPRCSMFMPCLSRNPQDKINSSFSRAGRLSTRKQTPATRFRSAGHAVPAATEAPSVASTPRTAFPRPPTCCWMSHRPTDRDSNAHPGWGGAVFDGHFGVGGACVHHGAFWIACFVLG